jgi:hypothetical protein
MNSSSSKVNHFLSDIKLTFPAKFEIVEAIRKLFLNESNELIEEIKYGGISFNIKGKLIGGIYVYKNHISIEFSNGAEFSDPDTILEGKGKMRRHLKIIKLSDVSSKKTSSFIVQALKI